MRHTRSVISSVLALALLGFSSRPEPLREGRKEIDPCNPTLAEVFGTPKGENIFTGDGQLVIQSEFLNTDCEKGNTLSGSLGLPNGYNPFRP